MNGAEIGQPDDISGDVDYMIGKLSYDPFIAKLEKRLNEVKQNAELKRSYMLYLLHENEIRNEAYNEGLNEGRSEMLNTLIELMRSSGISNEQIDSIRNAALKS